MTNKKKAELFGLIIAVFAIIFDQASKFSILAFLPKGSSIKITEFLNLCLVFNFGTSFGLLNPETHIESCILVGVSILLIIFLIYVFFRMTNNTEKILCAGIIGGAIGNLIDRFLHGAVVDFIDVHYMDLHWPAFNVADSFISVCAVLLIVLSLFSNDKKCP
ncbi:MAG: signal peptidase II [Alphaproteobacteria bacterium]|nr:signal peptidase II [Alphaproteobacteria bacterium]